MDRDSVRNSWPDIVEFKEAILVRHGGIAVAGFGALQNHSGAWNGIVVRIDYRCRNTAGPLIWGRDLFSQRWGRQHHDQNCLTDYPVRNSQFVPHKHYLRVQESPTLVKRQRLLNSEIMFVGDKLRIP